MARQAVVHAAHVLCAEVRPLQRGGEEAGGRDVHVIVHFEDPLRGVVRVRVIQKLQSCCGGAAGTALLAALNECCIMMCY